MRASVLSGPLVALVSVADAFKYGYNHDTVKKDPELVAKNFEDVDAIELYSPAFLEPNARLPGFDNGTNGPSPQDVVEDFLQGLADSNKYMTYHTANFTSEEHRSFPYVHLSNGESSCQARRSPSTKAGKVRIWIQGAAHGNEPAGDESTLALLGKFDAEPEWAERVLDKVEIVVLPRYNPDGVFYFQRRLATNFDPNRDHIKLARQQTRDIKSLLSEYSPHVIVDMHEYTATRVWGDEDQYYHASDGMFSAAKNLNINEQIRTLAEELFAKNMGDDMESNGLRWEPYTTGRRVFDDDYVAEFDEAGTDGKIGRNAMGLTQSVTFLIEMRGIQIADQQFQRRVASGLTMLSSVVQTAVDNAEKVFTTVEAGIEEFIASTDDIVITDYSKSVIRPYHMVDITNGSVVRPPVLFSSSTPAYANLTRTRPEAYIIPVAWADLAERLRVSGLEIETLDKPFSGTIEALNITSIEVDSDYYEGALQVTATAEAKQRAIELPAGSFKVSTRQKNAALAIIALEPENIDSYVSFNIVPVAVGDEYPIFRVPS